MAAPLPRSFYDRPTLTVARELLGSILCRRVDGITLRGRIVETEAYVGEEDLACHARAGRTPRTAPLYGPPGIAYVYLTYGMHHLLNAVTESEGKPAAVLIRAIEPLEGVEWMQRARGLKEPHLLGSGPGKLARAFGLDLAWNRSDLCGKDLWIEPGPKVRDRDVRTSARIGCQNCPAPWDTIAWRFYVSDSRHVTPGRAERNGRKTARITDKPDRNLLVTNHGAIGNNRASRGTRRRSVRSGPRTRSTPSR